MGFCLISSVSAVDLDDSNILVDSNDLSSSSISTVSNDIGSNGSSNGNSKNEVLSTDHTVEDSDLVDDLNNKNSKNVLGSSALQATTKTKTSIVASSSSVYRGNPFSITLKNSSGKALANQKVSFKISNKIYNRTTDSKGSASLTINLKDGKYPIVCTFAETSAYKASSLSLNLSVSARPTVIKATNSTVIKGNPFIITLKDNGGNVLANQTVVIQVCGKTYNRTTSSNGIASLTINLNPNKYPIACSFGGSNNYKASTLSLNLTVIKNPYVYTIQEIKNAATNVKAYVLANRKLPNTVTVGSNTLKISEFSYLASKAINNINSNNAANINLLSGISNCGSSTHSLQATVYKAQYLDLSKGVSSTIESKKVPSTYVAVKNANNVVVGNADFCIYTFAFAKILDFHKSNSYLPNYCTFESSVIDYPVEKKSTSLKAGSTNITKGEAYTVTLVDSSGNKLSNQKITITLSGNSYSKTTDSNGVASLTINLAAGKYSITSAYGGSANYTACNLTSTINVKNSSGGFSLSDIKAVATKLKSYVNSKGQMPNTVTVADTKLTISQFSYLMTKAVYNINANNSNNINLPSKLSRCNSSGDYISATIYKAQYLDLANRVISFMESNNVPPVYAKVYSSSGSSYGNAEFDLYTFAFAKILDFHKSDGYLPNYCTFDSSVVGNAEKPIPPYNGSGIIKYNSSQFKNGLNEVNTETNLTKYLVGSGQSTITSSITNVANQLTKGLTTTDAKALAIYNYVRDEIDYSYYADSRYGASGTLSYGYGNCVDQASLVVALCRASGIHARYSHAQGCTFSSGLVTGHVWAQILVNGVWYSADATSVRNSLGNIVNWNTNSYYSLNKYVAVPF